MAKLISDRFVHLHVLVLTLSFGRGLWAADTPATILPAKPVVAVGNTLVIRMTNSFTNAISKCEFTFATTTMQFDIGGGTQCVMTIPVASMADAKSGSFIATGKDDTYTIPLEIIVYDATKNNTVAPITLVDGENEVINYVNPNNPEIEVLYCFYTKPDLTTTEIGPTCSYSATPATDADAGIWGVTAGYLGSTLEVTTTAQVTLTPRVGTIGTWTKKDKIYTLSCKVGKPIKMCRFHQPSTNITISLSDGISNAEYKYTGAGLAVGDCEMTSVTPFDSDTNLGLWKCYWIEEQKTLSRFLVLTDAESGNYRDINETEFKANDPTVVYSIVGMKDVQLDCSVEGAVLDYCWFTAPDSSHHVPTSLNEDELKYGLCSYNISEVSSHDEGVWTCHMGVFAKGAEITTTISLQIKDSLMVPENDYVPAQAGALITCKIIDVHKELRYCRYVRPDSLGFSLVSNETWSTYKSTGKESIGLCQLEILEPKSEDIGTWTCAGRLFRSSIDMEHKAVVAITSQSSGLSGGEIAGIVFGVLLLLGIIVGALVWFFKFRK